MERDGGNKSLWQQHDAYQTTGTANLHDLYDVIIIGGGITGLTTAVLLQASGKKCLLVEAYTIGFGTTGGTTAHLNTFFDTPYNKVIKNFGAKNAKLLAQGAKSAISLIKKIFPIIILIAIFQNWTDIYFQSMNRRIRN